MSTKQSGIKLGLTYRIFILFFLHAALKIMKKYKETNRSDEIQTFYNEILSKYFLPKARKQAFSFIVRNRNFSATCFSLLPLEKDLSVIQKLVNDKHFLVRSMATMAAIQLQNKEAVYTVLKSFNKLRLYENRIYSYKLLQFPKITGWIAEIASTDPDRDIHVSCLYCLSKEKINAPIPFLEKDLLSADKEIKALALEILMHNPQEKYKEFLYEFLGDPDENIRKIAIQAMLPLEGNKIMEALRNKLEDESWNVRLQAGIILKKKGTQGLEILRRQKENINSRGYEVAEYVAQFDN